MVYKQKTMVIYSQLTILSTQMNKQNSRKNCNTSRTNTSQHPSQQSQAPVYRPSIKVGYKVIHPIVEQKRAKRKIEPNIVNNERANCKKMGDDVKTMLSGKFVNSQYIKYDEKKAVSHQKRGVTECRQKYQSGQGVKQQMNNQITNNSRRSSSVASISTSRSKNMNILPSYQNTGIKDIMQYHHARPYRQTPITQKCTSTTALSRFCKFQDLHEFDFRKRPEFLR